MPLARIDLAADTSPEIVKAIGDVVYDAMIQTANVPEHDKFQIVNRHAGDELVYPAAGYLGVTYTSKIVFIQITWSTGRSVEVKKAFYKAIAEGIHEKTGIRKEDVWISLVESNREDWSFGGGEMQYAAK
ncbi:MULTISPECIES: tautomerase family protein [unclassified Pseudomonas]|uniref:tautomerase family protein n=1 Tax=unclassified Pseudomonas TaxID=196821 RepID=UPI002AC8E73F|nr:MULTISPECIES: tautomerase family protein [unclassified Pseudomonas]MEB0043061.1 tautomerase family protein [Pseudomonas sp. MH10]MEB0080243.1 tautomerase family protein [Pseudomonas sp. MH10out]MEB0094308.1 tautomerase family protein [Pseudomonas sp. CCI4.2]MEB0104493.1 tautomerase family protein [Pseudomonas sp. CCI3.2]MEB0121452.1 tautomerase family protein [Pseudomonas sp. CCI1.2]